MQQPKQCDLTFAPHNCCLYDCPPDDPFHIHVCFADDFDFSEGDVVKLRLGLITVEEFDHNGRQRAMERRNRVLNDESAHCADELQRRSYQVAMLNKFERGLEHHLDKDK